MSLQTKYNFLPERRQSVGLSQTELAKKIGKNLTTINRYERGNRAMTKPVIDQISRALGCETYELFTRPRQDESCDQNS